MRNASFYGCSCSDNFSLVDWNRRAAIFELENSTSAVSFSTSLSSSRESACSLLLNLNSSYKCFVLYCAQKRQN